MLDPGAGTAEQRAHALIDAQLTAAGWVVQNRKEMNLYAGPGVAVRESIMAPGHGRADYLLYVDKRAAGTIEAKPEGTTLSGVESQHLASQFVHGVELVFFDRKPAAEQPWTEKLWIYDFRSNQHFTSKQNPPNLDITWLRDASLEDLDDLPDPEVIAREIVEDLTLR